MKTPLAARLPILWFQRRLAPALWLLLPLSGLFALIAGARRLLYRTGLLRSIEAGVPVIVVGNITVGGSGKTPLVLALVDALRAQGYTPGIITRGYGRAADAVHLVTADDTASSAGDEPLLLARRAACPVAVGRDRVAAAALLHATAPEVDVLLSDDGLQHYRLRRTVEIAVFDGRGIGNGHLLPAGPLREPVARLATVDAVVWNGPADARVPCPPAGPLAFALTLRAAPFQALNDARRCCTAAELAGRRLYAIAGIGNPQRFFDQLSALGLSFSAHAFPDHHAYTASDLAFAADGVLLMTEKDAVKCAALTIGEAWVLPVEAVLPPGMTELIVEKLNGCAPSGHTRLPHLQGKP